VTTLYIAVEEVLYARLDKCHYITSFLIFLLQYQKTPMVGKMNGWPYLCHTWYSQVLIVFTVSLHVPYCNFGTKIQMSGLVYIFISFYDIMVKKYK